MKLLVIIILLLISSCSYKYIRSVDCFSGDTWGEKAEASCKQCKNEKFYVKCKVVGITKNNEVICECEGDVTSE